MVGDATRNAHEGIDMAPGYHEGIVYVATVPGNNEKFYGGGGSAFCGRSTPPAGASCGTSTRSPKACGRSGRSTRAAGMWYTPAFDGARDMYVGIANPGAVPGTASSPWGSSRPGANLYTDSIVKLNAATGKVDVVPPADAARPVRLGPAGSADPLRRRRQTGGDRGGKAGVVIALDPQRQAAVEAPGGRPQRSRPRLAVRDARGILEADLPETVYPGLLGGVIAPMASDGSTVFAPVVNLPVTFTSQTEQAKARGREKWWRSLQPLARSLDPHVLRPVFGAVTVANDVVFATIRQRNAVRAAGEQRERAVGNKLPAGTNTGVAINGDTLIAPAGLPQGSSQAPELVAFRLPSASG